LHRFGTADNQSIAQAIMKSIKERSVTDEEMGRFWRETELSWWWYRAPIELRVDRDMEYIHLKDQRGSGTEPVNVISRYKYQDGLGYYESTRDTASHFFIDYLPKGVYVFEYSTRVQHRGQYQTGVADIQCMYAPEFNSHSESLPLVVR
jgi:hypothetical protein